MSTLLATLLLAISSNFVLIQEDKLVTEAKVSDQSGKQRLLLRFSESDISENKSEKVIARDFHSLAWETNDGKSWSSKRVISQLDFEVGKHGKRWISELHSFDSATGRAIIKVAEMVKPDETNTSHCIYSWREWDLLKNEEVRLIRECKEPFESYEKRIVVLPKAVIGGESSVEKALDEARTLARQGKYEEALQKHIWFHENVPTKAPAMSAVRLSFALSYWSDLAQKYPKAKEALLDIRDKSAKKLIDGKGSYDVFSEVAAINKELHEQDKTVALFKSIHEKRKDIAFFCYMTAEKDLVASREYQLCSSYIKDPLQKFSQINWKRTMTRNPTKNEGAGLAEMVDTSFVEELCELIEIMEGAGRHEDALKVQTKATAAVDTPEMRKATENALLKGQGK